MIKVLEKAAYGVGYIMAFALMLGAFFGLLMVLVNVVGLPVWGAILILLVPALALHFFLTRNRDAPELKMRDSVWNDPDDA